MCLVVVMVVVVWTFVIHRCVNRRDGIICNFQATARIILKVVKGAHVLRVQHSSHMKRPPEMGGLMDERLSRHIDGKG